MPKHEIMKKLIQKLDNSACFEYPNVSSAIQHAMAHTYSKDLEYALRTIKKITPITNNDDYARILYLANIVKQQNIEGSIKSNDLLISIENTLSAYKNI